MRPERESSIVPASIQDEQCSLVLASFCTAGHNLPGVASQFATQNPGFAMHCCSYMYVANDV